MFMRLGFKVASAVLAQCTQEKAKKFTDTWRMMLVAKLIQADANGQKQGTIIGGPRTVFLILKRKVRLDALTLLYRPQGCHSSEASG